jgi:hypothetical protein
MFASPTKFDPEGIVGLSLKIGPKCALDLVAKRSAHVLQIAEIDSTEPVLTDRSLSSALVLNPTNVKCRAIYFGNEHGLLIPFLADAVSRELIQVPVRVTNFDYHADIDTYNSETLDHTASWQRLGCNLGLWRPESCLNVRPSSSSATPRPDLYPIGVISDIVADDLIGFKPSELVSVDLDYFNDTIPSKENTEQIRRSLNQAQVAMIFSSSGWTAGYQSSENLRKACRLIAGIDV